MNLAIIYFTSKQKKKLSKKNECNNKENDYDIKTPSKQSYYIPLKEKTRKKMNENTTMELKEIRSKSQLKLSRNFSGNPGKSVGKLTKVSNINAASNLKQSNIAAKANNVKNPDSIYVRNKLLKSKIMEIENKLRSYGFSTFDEYSNEQSNKSHLRIELEIFKERTENLGNQFIETIHKLKEDITNDKTSFLKKNKRNI